MVVSFFKTHIVSCQNIGWIKSFVIHRTVQPLCFNQSRLKRSILLYLTFNSRIGAKLVKFLVVPKGQFRDLKYVLCKLLSLWTNLVRLDIQKALNPNYVVTLCVSPLKTTTPKKVSTCLSRLGALWKWIMKILFFIWILRLADTKCVWLPKHISKNISHKSMSAPYMGVSELVETPCMYGFRFSSV